MQSKKNRHDMEQARAAREAMYRAVDRVAEERHMRARIEPPGTARTAYADELIDALGQEGCRITSAHAEEDVEEFEPLAPSPTAPREEAAPTPCPACRRGDHGGCWTHDPTRQGGGDTALRCPCAHPSTPADREAVGALADAVKEVARTGVRLNVVADGIATGSMEEAWAMALASVLDRDGWRVVPYVDAEVVEDDPDPLTGRLRDLADWHDGRSPRATFPRAHQVAMLREAADVIEMVESQQVDHVETVDGRRIPVGGDPVTDSMSLVSRLRSWAHTIRAARGLPRADQQRVARLIRDAADVMQAMNEEIVHLRDTVDEQHDELRAVANANTVAEELLEAIRLTQEYAQLPAVDGWSWWDVYRKYRPTDARRLRTEWEQHRDAPNRTNHETREAVLVLQESHGAVGERPMWFAGDEATGVTVVLTHREWNDLGRPDTVTVAMWPGGRTEKADVDPDRWKPGDPCGNCGSTNTGENHVIGGFCHDCGATDSDEV